MAESRQRGLSPLKFTEELLGRLSQQGSLSKDTHFENDSTLSAADQRGPHVATGDRPVGAFSYSNPSRDHQGNSLKHFVLAPVATEKNRQLSHMVSDALTEVKTLQLEDDSSARFYLPIYQTINGKNHWMFVMINEKGHAYYIDPRSSLLTYPGFDNRENIRQALNKAGYDDTHIHERYLNISRHKRSSGPITAEAIHHFVNHPDALDSDGEPTDEAIESIDSDSKKPPTLNIHQARLLPDMANDMLSTERGEGLRGSFSAPNDAFPRRDALQGSNTSAADAEGTFHADQYVGELQRNLHQGMKKSSQQQHETVSPAQGLPHDLPLDHIAHGVRPGVSARLPSFDATATAAEPPLPPPSGTQSAPARLVGGVDPSLLPDINQIATQRGTPSPTEASVVRHSLFSEGAGAQGQPGQKSGAGAGAGAGTDDDEELRRDDGCKLS